MSITLTINAADPADLHAQLSAMLGSTPTAAVTTAPKVTPPKADPKPVEAKVEAPPVEEAKAEPEAEITADPEPSSDPAALTYDDHIKPAVLKVSAKHGRPGVEKLLADFKVANAREVPEAQWPELLAAVEALLK